jgi:hypothetical protein
MDAYMDAYCERTGPGPLAEPLNAITNASFLIAAWAAWLLGDAHGPRIDRHTRTGTAGRVRWHWERALAHGPQWVDADPGHHPDPHLPGLFLLAVLAGRGPVTDALGGRVDRRIPDRLDVGPATRRRSARGVLLHTGAHLPTGARGLPHAGADRRSVLAALGRWCVLSCARLPHNGPRGLFRLSHRDAFPLAQPERPGRLPGDALPHPQQSSAGWGGLELFLEDARR